MSRGTAPSARDAAIFGLLGKWDGSRLDTNLDGKIDQAGAAIMDAWWPRFAVAVLQPVLGPLTDQLKTLAPISDDANSGGSSYDAGWYGYVEQDLAGPARREERLLDEVLRQRRSQCVRRGALAIARCCGQRAGRGAGFRSVSLAIRRNEGAHPLRGLPPGHDAVDEPPDVPAGHGLPLTPLAWEKWQARSTCSRRGRRPCRRRCSQRSPSRSCTTAAPTSARSTSAA